MSPVKRYTAVAIVLHWAIAIAIILNLGIGWWMHEAIDAAASRAQAVTAFQLHKSIGLLVLVLSFLRLAWRWLNPPPPLPATMGPASRRLAVLVHWLFYALMIAVPLTGWVMVSLQWRGDAPLNVPTLWFGLFEVPHLFALHESAAELRAGWWATALSSHELLANLTALLLIAHIAAALIHHFYHHDDVLARMFPVAPHGPHGAAARTTVERRILRAGRVLIAVSVLALFSPLLNEPETTDSAGAVKATKIESAAGAAVVDATSSYIKFSGEHAGAPFSGRFTRWRVDAQLDAATPENSVVEVFISTGSADTGNSLNDSTLKEAEWFDVARYPEASFISGEIVRGEGDLWLLNGTLTIKDRTVSVDGLRLRFAADGARVDGEVSLDRSDVDLGMESDPTGEWVSQVIVVKVAADFRS